MTATVTTSIVRPTFDAMGLSIGKRTRLHRLMYEHGPVEFVDNPDAIDTDWIYRLAVQGNFSGIALHVGLAEKYQTRYAGRVPLVLKDYGQQR